MDSIQSTFESVKEALLKDPAQLAHSVALALTYAGAFAEWDSGTIEEVLRPLQFAAEAVGIAEVGNTGADGAALKFWCDVADSFGIDRPEYDFDNEEDN